MNGQTPDQSQIKNQGKKDIQTKSNFNGGTVKKINRL